MSIMKRQGKAVASILTKRLFKFLHSIFLVAPILFSLTASNGYPAQVTLAWDASTDPKIVGYKIHYGNSSGSYQTVIDVGNIATYTISNLLDGTPYYFVATDYNTSGIESGYSNEVVFNPPPACTYSILPVAQSFNSSGGPGTVSVAAQTGCTWTDNSNAPWLIITSNSTGTGSGTVYYSASANSGSGSRIGTLTIAGKSFTVNQAGVSNCSYSISPTSSSFSASGGTGSVSVNSASGCSWTAVSNASWITILSGASGSGNGAASYSLAANTGTTTRSGSMTVASQTFTVTQAGSNAAPIISVEPTLVIFGNVRLGAYSSAIVKITNSGNAPLLINYIWFFGTNADQFMQTNACTTLAPGSSCDIKVTFAPGDPGALKAVLGITSNDPAKGWFYVPLSGTGL